MKDSLLTKVLYILTTRQKITALILGGLILISACLEVFSISLILPLMQLMGNTDVALKYAPLMWLYKRFHLQSSKDLITIVAAVMFLSYVIKSIYMLFVNNYQYKFIFSSQIYVSNKLYSAFIYCPYTFHLKHNSAQLLRSLTTDVRGFFEGVVNSILTLLTEIVVLLCIVGFLFYMDPLVSLSVVTLLGVVSVGIHFLMRTKLSKCGKAYQHFNGMILQSINQGLGGIKEIKILGREKYFLDDHSKYSTAYAAACRIYCTLIIIPRLFMETLVIGGLLIVLILSMTTKDDITDLLPILSLFAIAALRILPSFNKVMSAISTLKFNIPSVCTIYKDLREFDSNKYAMVIGEGDFSTPSCLSKKPAPIIKFENVSYTYPESNEGETLKKISFEINEGESIGIVGPSGSGKTTLVDLMLGLLRPNQGSIARGDGDADMSKWKQAIGYVPQSIYLCDDTVLKNVAFGVEESEIDFDKVMKAVKLANLSEVVEKLPDKYYTIVGERGIRLSGGERQRIGIARALYHNPKLIVLDEATSSLDYINEGIISDAIDALAGKKTLIIIAHRLTTVKKCNKLFYMESGQITSSGTFEQLFKRKCVG